MKKISLKEAREKCLEIADELEECYKRINEKEAKEAEFLDEIDISDKPLNTRLWYNSTGDCLHYLDTDEAVVGQPVNQQLTLYTSPVSEEVIGFQLLDFSEMIKDKQVANDILDVVDCSKCGKTIKGHLFRYGGDILCNLCFHSLGI